jgi:hypothetical protein
LIPFSTVPAGADETILSFGFAGAALDFGGVRGVLNSGDGEADVGAAAGSRIEALRLNERMKELGARSAEARYMHRWQIMVFEGGRLDEMSRQS